VPPQAALSRSVFGGSSRPPTESRRLPDLPDGKGRKRRRKRDQIPS
jgi:hypothetical protein